MISNTDPELKAFIVDKLTDTSDTTLLGRKMTEGFVKHWEQQVTQGSGWDRDLGVRMVNTSKIRFSRTDRQAEGKNLRVETGRWSKQSTP